MAVQQAYKNKAIRRKKFDFSLSKKTAPYVFLSPIMILLLIFTIYPTVYSFVLSLQTLQAGKYVFVGFENYIKLFSDKTFLQTLYNTFIILLIQVPIMLSSAFVIAIGLNRKRLFGRGLLRAAFFMPTITSLTACSIVFGILLSTDFGLVNLILKAVGLQPLPWLTSPVWAMASVIMVVTWRWTGYNAVIFLAGLQNIPDELYESAEIDGANSFGKFIYITVPMMKPIILFTLIMATNGTFHLFNEPFILTGGGPSDSTMTVALYLYNTGFRYFKMGYASAISYVLVVLIGGLSLIQNKVLGGKENENME